MSRRSRTKFIRAWHRRLGPIIGVQLLLWSLGGIYFAWGSGSAAPIEDEPENLKFENYLAPIPPLIRNSRLDRVADIQLGKLLNIPAYRFIQDDRHAETYNAINGEKLSPIGRTTAISVAQATFDEEMTARMAELIETSRASYRSALPAWRVVFDDWKATVIYVNAHTGLVTARRNFLWRAYDILWWLPFWNEPHGEPTRRWIVRVTAIFGVVTVLSGYYLWILSAPQRRSKKKKSTAQKSKSK